MFEGASNLAAGVDRTFMLILDIAIFFIVGITVFMIWTVIRYNRKKNQPAKQFTGSTVLEIIWTGIPLILVMVIFAYGWKGYAPMRKVPADAMKITAVARKWQWSFDYGNGKISKTLVIPVNKAIKLNLHSLDVNHGLFIPAFRVKEDVIPGYDNYLWFIPKFIGEYDIFCSDYCGLQHSGMNTKANVVEEAAFTKWLDSLPATGNIPDPAGLALLKDKGCIACHSLDGTRLVGPSFKNFNGKKHLLVEDGAEKEIEVTDDYIISSILEPNKQIVKGFNRGLMQPYRNQLTDEQIKLISDFLKTLVEK